jgi:phosphoribosylformylglycinamidine cyclo-ligase
MALIGGETAEMPDLYKNGEYDLAGFAVGIVDKAKVLDKEMVSSGDSVIALASSGLHSNGYSLARKVLDINEFANSLLTPTKIYAKPILELVNKVHVKSIANITGGGILENLPRALNSKVSAKIYKSKIKTHSIFESIQKAGNISEKEMFSVFNMGLGMCAIVPKNETKLALSILNNCGEQGYIVGEIAPGNSEVHLV